MPTDRKAKAGQNDFYASQMYNSGTFLCYEKEDIIALLEFK